MRWARHAELATQARSGSRAFGNMPGSWRGMKDLWQRAPPGGEVASLGPLGKTDGSAVRQAVPEDEKEPCG
jgi:hypothetical protein